MFTDLVGSTAWRTDVGELIADLRTAELDQRSREVITAAGGSVVKGTEDGVMATFTSATAALEAAASPRRSRSPSASGCACSSNRHWSRRAVRA